jgi:hypothetical protein
MMRENGFIQKDTICMDFNQDRKDTNERNKVFTWPCHNDGVFQKWSHENGMIKHLSANLCLELSENNNEMLFMKPCDQMNQYQKWKWARRERKVVY